MIPEIRKEFNSSFTSEKYEALYQYLREKSGISPDFRLSESPIFLPQDFKEKLFQASENIIEQISQIPKDVLQKAVPKELNVPNETNGTEFLVIDYGICTDKDQNLSPQLIELQGFPSLYAFQPVLKDAYMELYPFLSSLEKETKSTKEKGVWLKEVVLEGRPAENVVLLEIFPQEQKTRIDFFLTEKITGISTVCLTEVKSKGKQLFYEKNGELIQIKRIYNRVIFDELSQRKDLTLDFEFSKDWDVEWIPHPNWFFMISKYILPRLKGPFIPESYFADSFPCDQKPSDYVLKPLFSFAGSGVNLNPTRQDIEQISDPQNYILQKKVAYAPLFEDINGEKSKAEIRMLYLWNNHSRSLELFDYIVRMTKSQMANVNFNKKDAIWIGSSAVFFEEK